MKRYTAREMREIADAFEPRGVVARIPNGNGEREILARDIVAMLRQAADDMERERKYEFAKMWRDGDTSCHSDYMRVAESSISDMESAYCTLVRRSVGEWEECNGND